MLFFGLLWGAGGFAQAQQIRVITTIPDLADITKQIGKELVDVESLTSGVEFMHAVPVKPSFVPKLNRADILVAMGLDLEISWLPALLEAANNSKIMPGQPGHIDCSTGINVLDVPQNRRPLGRRCPSQGQSALQSRSAQRQNHRAQYRRRFGAQFSAT